MNKKKFDTQNKVLSSVSTYSVPTETETFYPVFSELYVDTPYNYCTWTMQRHSWASGHNEQPTQYAVVGWPQLDILDE